MNTERLEVATLILALIAFILLFVVIITGNVVVLKNIELNQHILEDCKIEYTELPSLDVDDF